MFVVLITYIKPLDTIDQFLAKHRAYLETGYQKNYFVTSGPQNPRVGGVIISQLKDRAQLENVIAEDPFKVNGLAEYNIIEFDPVKYHDKFREFI